MINIFGIKLYLYGFFIGLGVWVAWEVALRVAKRKDVDEKIIDGVAWWMIAGGIIGARVYHVIDYWERYYRQNIIKVFFVWQGGLGIWGAVIGGILGLLIYRFFLKSSKKGRVNILRILDVAIVGVPLGQAIGRLGNWANKELYGKNGEPLFAYEGILNLILFLILWKLSYKKIKQGYITGMYLIGYGVIRMALENLRSEAIIWKLGGVPMAILFGLVSTGVGIYLLLRKKSTSQK